MAIETQMNTNSELLILLCFIVFLWYFYVAKFLPSLSSKVKSHNLWSFYTEQHLRHKHEATEMICTVTYRCERNPTVKHTYTEPHYIEHIKTKFCWNTILYLVYVFISFTDLIYQNHSLFWNYTFNTRKLSTSVVCCREEQLHIIHQ